MVRLALLFLMAVAGFAQQANAQPTPTQPNPVNTHHVLRIPGQENAKLVADVVYTGEGTDAQKTDLYIPADAKPSNKRSLVIALRSEEHTSELQSLTNLVCRLLLEKK